MRVAMMGSLISVLFFAPLISAQEIQTYCEWKEKNMAVQDPYPEFYWKVDNQTHCRVLVSATKTELAHHRGEMWDSGKVETILPVLEYAGKPLDDGDIYYWKTLVWTERRPDGFWTKPQEFRLKISLPIS